MSLKTFMEDSKAKWETLEWKKDIVVLMERFVLVDLHFDIDKAVCVMELLISQISLTSHLRKVQLLSSTIRTNIGLPKYTTQLHLGTYTLTFS